MSTSREQILNVLHRRNSGRIPLAAYSFLLFRGKTERSLRNRGCGLIHFEKAFTTFLNNIEISTKDAWENGTRVLYRRYKTPVGELTEKVQVDPAYHSQWIQEYLIKKPDDYRIACYIAENTVYCPNTDLFLEAEDNLGEDGIIVANLDRLPFQKTLIELAGTERLCFDLSDNPEVVEELFQVLTTKQEEMYRLAIDSPAAIIHTWDNITEDITSPRLFERYCLPLYQRYQEMIHRNKKLFMVHMDGKLAHLKNLIAQSGIDVIESFSLPDTGGNLPPEEIGNTWPDKAIMANVPAFLCYRDEAFIERYIADLITRVPRERFMLCVSEDLPQPFWKKTLSLIDKALKHSG